MENVKIDTEFIKLSQMMKMSNIVQSGGESKQLISMGLVLVNGEVCTQRGKKLYPDDRVEFDGKTYIITL